MSKKLVLIGLVEPQADMVEAFNQWYLGNHIEDTFNAPHISAVAIRSEDGVLVTGLGNSARAAIEVNPAVSLLCTPTDRREFSLIVDGDAEADGEEARITPGRAILHRAAPNPDADGDCGHDCKEL